MRVDHAIPTHFFSRRRRGVVAWAVLLACSTTLLATPAAGAGSASLPRQQACKPRPSGQLDTAPTAQQRDPQHGSRPRWRITEFSLPHPDSTPLTIILGRDCNLWFTEVFGTGNRIGRMTVDGTVTEYPLPSPDSRPL